MIDAGARPAISEYVEVVRDALWLGHWRIDLVWDGDIDPHALGTIEPTYGQKHAQLRLCHDFLSMEPWKQRRVIVHELLHCHSADVQQLGEQLRTNLGDQAYEAWFPGFRLAVEHMVDGITTVLAHQESDFIPLPDLPKPADGSV